MSKPLHLRGFADAVSAVLGLHDRFGYAHAAALVDDDGRVWDLTTFTDPKLHTEDSALDWADCFLLNHEGPTGLILLSAVHGGTRELRDEHVRKFHLVRKTFGEHGIEVLDWLRFDGEWIRSLAFTTGAGTWAQDGRPTLRGGVLRGSRDTQPDDYDERR